MSTSLGELSKAAADVIASAAPSVVGVGRAGSGVVVGQGLVVTNAHNLRGEVQVTFDDGRVAVANVAGDGPGGRPGRALRGHGGRTGLDLGLG